MIAPHHHAIPETPGLIGLRLLIRCRWMAILGQFLIIMIVHFGLGFAMPLAPVLGLVLVSLVLNLACVSQQHVIQRLDERTLCGLLVFDIAQLSALLYLTGGTANPFVILLLGPMVVAAILLSFRLMIAIMAWTFASLGMLALYHQPLPWPAPGFNPPPLYIAGYWGAMVLAMVFICIVVGLIQQENKRMNQALTITRMALAREQQVSALGALAAAAAHELGSPLATLRLVATEMARAIPADHPLAEDVALLVSETARCRDILADLSRDTSQNQTPHPFELLPLEQIIHQAIAPYSHSHINIIIDNHLADDLRLMPILMTPELRHGLGNLLQNACQFADKTVRIVLDQTPEFVRMAIYDDGPGFAPGVLHRLGEPYFSMRPADHGDQGNLGLGIFIARTLLEKQGAHITFEQPETGGAMQIIRWSRANFLSLERRHT